MLWNGTLIWRTCLSHRPMSEIKIIFEELRHRHRDPRLYCLRHESIESMTATFGPTV